MKLNVHQKAILIECNRNRVWSEESRRKISEALTGKTHETSEETKKKISEAKKGTLPSGKTIQGKKESDAKKRIQHFEELKSFYKENQRLPSIRRGEKTLAGFVHSCLTKKDTEIVTWIEHVRFEIKVAREKEKPRVLPEPLFVEKIEYKKDRDL